jgi:PadR family transcriptional regulator, regulatory protein PadR
MSKLLDARKAVIFPPEQANFFRLSSLDEIILIVLSSNELYGLQVVDAFNEVSGGKRKLSIGTLYPALSRLEKQKLIVSRVHDGTTLAKGGARRKFFKVTESGAHTLAESRRFKNEMSQWRPGYGTGQAVWA